MNAIGYIFAIVVAGLLAVGGQYYLEREFKFTRNLIVMALLAFVGTYGGSELFGEIGRIHSLSENGPHIGGFYLLTGILGGLVLVATTVFGMTRQLRHQPTDMESQGISDPKLAHLLFNDSRVASLWLGIRLFVGYEWLSAGYHKVSGTGWMDGGSALKGFWTGAVAVPANGSPRITYGWYREFLQYMLNHEWYTWFAKIVAIGELLIGIGMILGVLVGFAAFFGALMNFNFMLAGSASTNPVLFGLAIALILAWKVAGYWGVDRVLLPLLGAPWSPGKAFVHTPREAPTTA
jgi:thiosulfate dehydrogenase [quinone] large subunit